MKTKEEILKRNTEAIAKCNVKYNVTHQGILNAMEEYATQCQEDMVDEKLDEDDIKEMALDFIINTGGLPKTIEDWQNALWKFYQSLNKQDNEN